MGSAHGTHKSIAASTLAISGGNSGMPGGNGAQPTHFSGKAQGFTETISVNTGGAASDVKSAGKCGPMSVSSKT